MRALITKHTRILYFLLSEYSQMSDYRLSDYIASDYSAVSDYMSDYAISGHLDVRPGTAQSDYPQAQAVRPVRPS